MTGTRNPIHVAYDLALATAQIDPASLRRVDCRTVGVRIGGKEYTAHVSYWNERTVRAALVSALGDYCTLEAVRLVASAQREAADQARSVSAK